MKCRRIGRILISEDELCQWLGYEGGEVVKIGRMDAYDALGVLIVHPDMPIEVPHGGEIPQVERRSDR